MMIIDNTQAKARVEGINGAGPAAGRCGGNCAICRHAVKAAADFSRNPLVQVAAPTSAAA